MLTLERQTRTSNQGLEIEAPNPAMMFQYIVGFMTPDPDFPFDEAAVSSPHALTKETYISHNGRPVTHIRPNLPLRNASLFDEF
jgi:hypothetical protein